MRIKNVKSKLIHEDRNFTETIYNSFKGFVIYQKKTQDTNTNKQNQQQQHKNEDITKKNKIFKILPKKKVS